MSPFCLRIKISSKRSGISFGPQKQMIELFFHAKRRKVFSQSSLRSSNHYSAFFAFSSRRSLREMFFEPPERLQKIYLFHGGSELLQVGINELACLNKIAAHCGQEKEKSKGG